METSLDFIKVFQKNETIIERDSCVLKKREPNLKIVFN